MITKIGTIGLSGARGLNTTALKVKIGSKTLKPGAYQAVLVATDVAGNRSRPVTVSFTVKS